MPKTGVDPTTSKAAMDLQAEGMIPTPQRVAILEALRRRGYHPTMEELEGDLKAMGVEVGTTTLYLSVRQFVLAGLVHSITDHSGRIRYGGYPEPHLHIQCTICQQILDVEGHPPEVSMPEGWEALPSYTTLVVAKGNCPQCKTLAGLRRTQKYYGKPGGEKVV